MTLVPAAPHWRIRAERSSIKWTRYPSDVIPLFVAEMDYGVAPEITASLVERVQASDLGYIDSPGPLTGIFAKFAALRWGWHVDAHRVRVATDVSVGIVETLRYGILPGAKVVITPPIYPPFYELVDEAGAETVEVPLIERRGVWSIDLEGLERAFANGAEALLLCNPHNPLGLVHAPETMLAMAELAAKYNVLVISDEVHAPLTHPDVEFSPFAMAATTAGAHCVTVTSASKGWNLAGAKCALVIANDDDALRVLDRYPDEVASRTSILGLHANVTAFTCTDWLDDAIAKIVDNDRLLAELVAEHLPRVRYHRPRAGYLGWLDFRALGLGDDPAGYLLNTARVALNPGHTFGKEGRGFARINLACEPGVLREAIERITEALD